MADHDNGVVRYVFGEKLRKRAITAAKLIKFPHEEDNRTVFNSRKMK